MGNKLRGLVIVLLVVLAGSTIVGVAAAQNTTEKTHIGSQHAIVEIQNDSIIQNKILEVTIKNLDVYENPEFLSEESIHLFIDKSDIRPNTKTILGDTHKELFIDGEYTDDFMQHKDTIGGYYRSEYSYDKNKSKINIYLDTTFLDNGNVDVYLSRESYDPDFIDSDSLDVKETKIDFSVPENIGLGDPVTFEGNTSRYIEGVSVYLRNKSSAWYYIGDVENNNQNNFSLSISMEGTLQDGSSNRSLTIEKGEKYWLGIMDWVDTSYLWDKERIERSVFYSANSWIDTFNVTSKYGLEIHTGTASPGSNVSLNIHAEQITAFSLNKIPDNWSIENIDSGGVGVRGDPDNDGKNESVGVAFAEKQSSIDPTIKLYVPENTEKRSYTLNVSVRNGETVSKEFSIDVSGGSNSIIDQYDTNDNGEIEGSEIREAIRDYLFRDSIGQNELKTLIREFILSG